MRYLMGVDGGNSKTYTLITDEVGKTMGSGISGGGNYESVGIERASRNIKDSIDKALKEANLQFDDIDFVQYGLAGADGEKGHSIFRDVLGAIPFKRWDLVCDTLEGLRLASPENYGVVLICGSGTNALGRSKDGAIVQTGGFGYLYGDAAGGRFLATETFRAAIRSSEYREVPSLLTKMIPEFLGFTTIHDVVEDFLNRSVTEIPLELTKVLHQAADQGDQLAIRLLVKVGYELGVAANSVIRRLGGFGEEVIPIVLIGSILQKAQNRHLITSLRETVERNNKKIKLVIPQLDPVYGSIFLAMDQLNIKVPSNLYQIQEL